MQPKIEPTGTGYYHGRVTENGETIALTYNLPFDENRGRLYNRRVFRVLLERALDQRFLNADELLKRRTG